MVLIVIWKHDGSFGFLGIGKTLELLRMTFFWPGMIKDVQNYIKNCETCKMVEAPFQRLYIDL